MLGVSLSTVAKFRCVDGRTKVYGVTIRKLDSYTLS